MSRALLKDLTKEEYWSMRKRLGTNELVAEELFVSKGTLELWVRKNKAHVGRKGNHKPRMDNKERIEIYTKLTKSNCHPRDIATRLKLKSEDSLRHWVRSMKKLGHTL